MARLPGVHHLCRGVLDRAQHHDPCAGDTQRERQGTSSGTATPEPSVDPSHIEDATSEKTRTKATSTTPRIPLTEADLQMGDDIMTNQAIPFDKIRALSDEVDAAASLIRHGLKVLEAYTFATRDADAVFVCLAGGIEKLLKLSAGVHSLDEVGSWPPKNVMMGWGHNIVELEQHVRALIVQHSARSTAPGLIAQLLDDVDNDPHIGKVLEALGTYAIRGRFYNLDHLADATQVGDSPGELWEQLHRGLTSLHPHLLAKMASPEQWASARTELNQHITSSVEGWRELILRAWRTGVLGDVAKQWAPQLSV